MGSSLRDKLGSSGLESYFLVEKSVAYTLDGSRESCIIVLVKSSSSFIIICPVMTAPSSYVCFARLALIGGQTWVS